jgi:2'-5' RNA ligase
MGNETAIIIPIAEAEPIVGQLRLQHDKAAQLGVPAHITLLYPFCGLEAVTGEIENLKHLCASIEAFPFSFTEVRRFPASVYLHPDKAERFAQITMTLVKKWPDYKPYNGAFSDIVPHLTVAAQVDTGTLAAVEDTLRHRLPIKCVAREVWLLTSDHTGMWSKKAAFAMGCAKNS